MDGNLTSDGLWTNLWNGENRRITIESRSALPAAAKVKEDWTILADGRWVERIVSTNNGTSYYPSQTNRYVWDNQVLLAVLDHTNGVVVSFMRGVDLSGSIQGAGGVGGVLAVQVGPAGPAGLAGTTHFTCYDGNGNVTALMNAATGEESARYEYAPFAEKLRETGPMAKLNPIRFSTQYADDVAGDTKYLFRDYQADTGRWLSRDPIDEKGGVNLYGFVQNSQLNAIDVLGLITFEGCTASEQESITKAFKDACEGAASRYWGCCMDDNVIRHEVRERCKNDNLRIVCVQKATYFNQCEKRCAYTYAGFGNAAIYLCPGYDSGDCDEVKCTIIHEMVHLANSFPASFGEKASYKSEICLGCTESNQGWPNGLSKEEKQRISKCLCK